MIIQLKQLAERLSKENEALKQEKQDMENDIKSIVHNLKDVWAGLGMNMSDMPKNKLAIATKIVTKLTKPSVQNMLEEKWNESLPILKKYEHLTTENNV